MSTPNPQPVTPANYLARAMPTGGGTAYVREESPSPADVAETRDLFEAAIAVHLGFPPGSAFSLEDCDAAEVVEAAWQVVQERDAEYADTAQAANTWRDLALERERTITELRAELEACISLTAYRELAAGYKGQTARADAAEATLARVRAVQNDFVGAHADGPVYPLWRALKAALSTPVTVEEGDAGVQ